MAELRQTIIHGYGDRLSVAPGERIEFKVSSEEPGTFRADVVRLIHGDTNPAGPSFKEEVIETGASGDIVPISGEATVERTVAGPAGDAGTAFTIAGLSREPGSAWVDSHLNGKVESPSVWDRALSVDELDALTAGGPHPRAASSPPGTSPRASRRTGSRPTASPTRARTACTGSA